MAQVPGSVSVQERTDTTSVVLTGDIDIAVTCLKPAADVAGLRCVIVDLRDVTFMDASGIGLLVELVSRNERVVLMWVPPHVERLLGICRLQNLLTMS